jgi:hypothetical protein
MSLTTLENQLSRLNILPNALNWRGGWSVSDQYYRNDVVISPNDGYGYILTVTSLQGGVDPAGNLADWIGIAPATGGGINSIVAGAGISIDNTNPQIPVVNNTGVLTAVAGLGLTNIGSSTEPEFDNNGVLSLAVAPASGLALSGTLENPILSSTGLFTLLASNGIVNAATAQDPSLENTRNTALYTLPSGGAFIAPGPHSYGSGAAIEIGRFTIPADAVPNSTALLYVKGWGLNNWNTTSPTGLMEYSSYFSRTVGSSMAFTGYDPFGFIDNGPPTNPSFVVPSSILNGVPHFSANQNPRDYVQQPLWIALLQINPSETVYAVTRVETSSITFEDPSITAPYLFYLKQ